MLPKTVVIYYGLLPLLEPMHKDAIGSFTVSNAFYLLFAKNLNACSSANRNECERARELVTVSVNVFVHQMLVEANNELSMLERMFLKLVIVHGVMSGLQMEF